MHLWGIAVLPHQLCSKASLQHLLLADLEDDLQQYQADHPQVVVLDDFTGIRLLQDREAMLQPLMQSPLVLLNVRALLAASASMSVWRCCHYLSVVPLVVASCTWKLCHCGIISRSSNMRVGLSECGNMHQISKVGILQHGCGQVYALHHCVGKYVIWHVRYHTNRLSVSLSTARYRAALSCSNLSSSPGAATARMQPSGSCRADS